MQGVVDKNVVKMFQTAASVLQSELSIKKPKYIVTFCRELDGILGGGIQIGSVTEISGESSCGKTQLAFQLSINVQMKPRIGGVAGEAVFIDTENTFSTTRLVEIADSVVQHCRDIGEDEEGKCTVEQLLSSIYMFKCLTMVELVATIHQMRDFLKVHSRVKLIVVDSIAHCVRAEENIKTRNKILNDFAQMFRAFAEENNVAVVLINQMTTRFSSCTSSGIMVPALGAAWSHVADTKIMLVKQNEVRLALLFKSSSQPRGVANYVIVRDGFRDPETKQTGSSNFTEGVDEKCKESNSIPKQVISDEFLHLSQKLLEEFCQNFENENLTYAYQNTIDKHDGETSQQIISENKPVFTENYVLCDPFGNSSQKSDDVSLTQVKKSDSFAEKNKCLDQGNTSMKRKSNDLQEHDGQCIQQATNIENKIAEPARVSVKSPSSPVLKIGNNRKRRKTKL